MKKKIAAVILAVMVSVTALAGCGTKENNTPASSSDLSVSADAEDQTVDAGTPMLEDGAYSVNVELSGGSGRATVESTATVNVTDGQAMATIVWSSTYYDYMIVDGEKYLNENGIGTVKHYPIPMHLQEAYKDLNIKEGSLPIAEEISKTVLSIPMYYGMTDEEVNYVIDKLNAFK